MYSVHTMQAEVQLRAADVSIGVAAARLLTRRQWSHKKLPGTVIDPKVAAAGQLSALIFFDFEN